MRLWSTVVLVSLGLSIVGCQRDARLAGFASFGARVQPSGAVSLSEAVAAADRYGETHTCVAARISEVCQTRGCWMMLSDGTHDVRVRFTASDTCTDGFLVPRNAAGRQAYVRGVVKRTEMPEDLARHYAEDAGKSPAEIARIVGPQPAITMLATGVAIAGKADLDPPAQ